MERDSRMTTTGVVAEFIDRHKLLDMNSLQIVALSGGADSVALLSILASLGFSVHAAHCNFHLRGEESDRDEQFCKQLCLAKNIPFHVVHFDTQTYSQAHHVSIEMAARELRYKWFEQLRSDIGAQRVCVAHHKDDSVETFMLNLIRGTGLRGLCGMKIRNGNVVRPLLCLSKDDIKSFLAAEGLSFVTDSTNLKDFCVRNSIRLNLLPLMRRLNPSVCDSILQTADYLGNAQNVLDESYASSASEDYLDTESFSSDSVKYYVVSEWLMKHGFSGRIVSQVLSAATGKSFISSDGRRLLVDRGVLKIVKPSLLDKDFVIPETGIYNVSRDLKIGVKTVKAYVSKDSSIATLSAENISFPLILRNTRNGDRFIPFGMKGTKLVSDLLTDMKKSVGEKESQLVLTDASGNILWLAGIRTDNRYRVRDGEQEVLEITLTRA